MAAARLYTQSLSNPGHAVRLMLERKGIEHRVVECLPGLHPLIVRAAGFRGTTLPALRIDGRRLQGSRKIARFLDELRPEPPLFPADPERRTAVEEAERWGERVLQPVPRRLFRWGATHDRGLRRWIAGDVVGMPAPGLIGDLNVPLAHGLARVAGATDERVRETQAALPGMLDRVDELVAAGTIGSEPNAADFQIGTTVRVLLAFEDIAPLVEGRPAADLGRRILPDYPGPVPRFLPPGWL